MDSEVRPRPGTHSEVSWGGQSCGGDEKEAGSEAQETGSGLTSFQRVLISADEVVQHRHGQRLRTRGDVPDDGVSTVASVVDGLNAVGVLCPRYQARNVNDS